MTKQVIAVGTVANDGNGDPLRDGMVKVNANFTDLYDRVDDLELITATPICGTKYPEFRQAVKYFVTKELYSTDYFYISKIENSVSGNVIIEVSKTSSLSAAGTVVMGSSRTIAAKTGWEIVALTAMNSSGLWGYMVIDWDKINAATSYTCATWPEGGLFVINTVKQATAPGGGGGANIDTLTDSTADIDGSKDMYVIDVATTGKTITLDDWANIVGAVKIKSISADPVTVSMKNTGAVEKFDGQAYPIILAQYGYVEIYPTATNEYILTGNDYTIDEP